MLTPKTQYNLSNAKDYFEQHLAVGDYYSEGQMVAGEWLGQGAQLLSLNGPVKSVQFLALCDNLNPSTGEKLTIRTKSKRKVINEDNSMSELTDRRVFYDFTISPPKSVSILALAGGDERILQVHDEAVRVAMRELERFASTRVRAEMKNEDRTTGNLVTAVFRHDTSRALDPHLHSHCIVFNATFDAAEGRWKALQNYEMLIARKYVENVYYHELARSLRGFGYGIENQARGDFIVTGVPKSLDRTFSKRHEEIDEQTRTLLEAEPELAGRNVAAVRDHIAHGRRKWKAAHVALDTLRRDWRRQMSDDEAETLQRIKDSASGKQSTASAMDEDEALRWAEDHVFDRKSLVREHELWRFALERGRGASFTLEDLHELTARRDYIRNKDNARRLTTRTVLQREWDIVCLTREGRNSHSPLIPEWEGKAALDAEQLAAARQILTVEDFIILFRGGAGTGKSFTLQTIHDALKTHGHTVAVLAPQRQQVAGLADDGMDGAQTVSAFLTRQRMKSGAVVIVDEAGQIGGQDMLALLTFVKNHGGRVILSGDTRQHAAVQASDALIAIEKYGHLPVAELNEIRRQDPTRARNAEEREWIAQYRQAVNDASEGELSRSFERLEEMGAVVECSLADQQEQLSRHYLELAKSGLSTLVVSQTWDEIHRVNDAVRLSLQEAGLIGKEEWQIATYQALDLSDAQKLDARYYGENSVIVFNQKAVGAPKGTTGTLIAITDGSIIVEAAGKIRSISFHHANKLTACQKQELRLSRGDRLQLKSNAKALRGELLLNGELVTVKRVKADGSIRLDDGRILPPDYRQFVRGYAVTSYASQGKTVDYVLLSDSGIRAATNAQQWYVTISRGRLGVKVFTTDKELLRMNVTRPGQSDLALDLVQGNAEALERSSKLIPSKKTWKQRMQESIRRFQAYTSIRARITHANRRHVSPTL